MDEVQQSPTRASGEVKRSPHPSSGNDACYDRGSRATFFSRDSSLYLELKTISLTKKNNFERGEKKCCPGVDEIFHGLD